MKRLIKLIGIILLIFFLALYLSSYNTSYYENKNILTEDAIKRFEKDLKEGKKINVNNYIEKEKNYNNKVSTYTLKLSNLIDKCINKSLKLVYSINFLNGDAKIYLNWRRFKLTYSIGSGTETITTTSLSFIKNAVEHHK